MSTLEERLRIIKTNLTERFSQREMSDTEYSHFLLEEMKSQKFIDEDYSYGDSVDMDFNDPEQPLFKLGTFQSKFQFLLNLSQINGLRENYLSLLNSPRSKKAEKDISNYVNLVQQVKSYLINTFEGQIITKQKYESSVKDFVYSKCTEMEVQDRFRSAEIYGGILAKFKYEELPFKFSEDVAIKERKAIDDIFVNL